MMWEGGDWNDRDSTDRWIVIEEEACHYVIHTSTFAGLAMRRGSRRDEGNWHLRARELSLFRFCVTTSDRSSSYAGRDE